MKKTLAVIASATLVLGGTLGLSLFPRTHTALASTGSPASTAITAGAAEAPTEADGPSYTASIRVPDAADGSEPADASKDGAEAAQLASQAKITADQANSAALAAIPGQVTKTELDNENGNLVYSVEVKAASGATFDVKVDAGNGQVLAQEQGGADEETGASEKKDADTDNIQLEQQGEH